MYFESILLSAIVLILNLEQLECLALKQVVILSRHNVRTPLSKTLWQFSPKPWPKWKEKSGYLTAKGELLEGYMGEYFASWLNKEGILPNECPSEENFYVYANTQQRTLESAKSFVKKGFPDCNIIIHNANKTDPIFNPYIHNTSAIFIQEALDTMNKQMKMLNLNVSYELLESILDYTKSDNCIHNNQCDLVKDVNRPFIKTGTKPNIAGPLKISNSAVDSFLMENYEGFDMNDVAWGNLTDKRWQTVMELSRSYHNIIFDSISVAKDLSEPLIKYLSKIFLNKSPKIALIMGHDANIYTLLTAMGFKPYNLVNQHEKAPVGGKIVFQKWDSGTKELLKIDYVYQSTEQMRNGTRLSLDNPPTFMTLELNGCKTDQNGFCLWADFVKLLATL